MTTSAVHIATVRQFDPATGNATVVVPGLYGDVAVEARAFLTTPTDLVDLPALTPGATVIAFYDGGSPSAILRWYRTGGGGSNGGGGVAFTAGAGLALTGTSLDVGEGTGINVGADSISVDTSTIATVASVDLKADAATTVTAGAGLTGGGDLSASRAFNVGAGAGITVAADTVAVDGTYLNGLYVPLARMLSTTAPLTGGGDLTANRTLDISTFTTAVKGVVPAPGTPSGRYLRDDGTWAAVSTGSVVVADGTYTDITVSGTGTIWNINANAVGTTEIANGAVTAAKVAADVATQAELDAVAAVRQPLDADLTTIAGLTATTDNVIQSVAGVWASRTPAQHKATLALVKADVGLSNVDNTSDATKPVSSATQTALNLKADAVRTITTTAPLIGGGDLTANRTIAINNFTATVAGAVPPPTTVTGRFLKDDGTWATALTSIVNDSITNAMLANMPTLTLKGNNTGVIGDPLDLTVAQTKTMLAIVTADVAGLDTALANKQPLDSDLTTIAGLAHAPGNMIQSLSGVWTSTTPTNIKTSLALVKADVGLGNVDNTSDVNKPVSTAQQTALNLKADKTINHIAGSGLIGGGDLSADRTFNVGGGTGISVAVDTVGLDLTYTDGRYINTLGDTMQGPLVLPTPYPVGDYDAAHKKFVNDMIAARPILWSDVQNKPDPQVTVNLTGPVAGNATANMTDLASITLNIAGVLGPNTVTLASHTVGNYVQSILGTTNQVNVSNEGAGEGTQHTLSLPQSIHTTAVPTFSGLSLGVPNGAAPFVITGLGAQTRVDNLNADMVDGKHAVDFADAEEVEALLGDLWFQGLYNPVTWIEMADKELYPLGDPGTLPQPGPTATELRNGMYWVANDTDFVGFIDFDASGRYGVGDAPVFVASGDWIIIVEAANVSKWLSGGPYPRLSDLKGSPIEGDGFFPPPTEEDPPPDRNFTATMYVRLADGSKAYYTTPGPTGVWMAGPAPGSADLGFVYQWIPFSAETFVKSEIEAHKADKEDPHGAAGYVTESVGDLRWMSIETNFDEDIQAAITVHEGDPNPHDQYVDTEEANATYSLLGHLHDGTYLPVQSFNDHVDSVVTPNPHDQYMTQEEADAYYAAGGHLHDDRYPMIDHTHPTYFYVSSTDVQSGAPAHVYIGSKDPTDVTIKDLIPPLSPGDLWIETFNIVPQPPVIAAGFTYTVNSGTSVTLKWTAWPIASQVTNITIERSTGAVPSWPATPGTVVLNSTTAAPNTLATFTNTGLTERTSYHYRIRATNAFGTSEWKE